MRKLILVTLLCCGLATGAANFGVYGPTCIQVGGQSALFGLFSSIQETEWDPFMLSPLQWLKSFLSPNEVKDEAVAPQYNADYVDANCVVIDGSDWLNVEGLLATDTVTCDGTATPTAEAGKITFSNGTVYNIEVSRGGTVIARFPCAGGLGMGTDEPNVLGNSDYDGTWSADDIASLRSGKQDEFHYNLKYGYSLWEHATDPDILVPYGTDGNPLTFAKAGYTKTRDVEGVLASGAIHNGAESLIRQKAENTQFLTNSFWSADGVNYDKKSAIDLYNRLNFEDEVIVAASAVYNILDVFTWQSPKEWTVAEFSPFKGWLSSKESTVDILEPLIDSDGEYITDSAGYLVFPFGG